MIGLTVQSNSVFALYSPRLSLQVATIRRHVQSSQAQNGTQTIIEEIEQIKAYDKAKREALEETGISGDAKMAQALVLENTLGLLLRYPFESIMMVFNFNAYNGKFISTCLRDDIWSIEALRDLVGSEMVKAYMLRDTYHGKLLQDDYMYLITNLHLLREYGSDPNADIQATDQYGEPKIIKSTHYFFGGSDAVSEKTTNYYNNTYGFISNEGGCPEGEFQEAFKEVVNSAKTLATLSSGKGVEWGSSSIWQMAKANARIRAREWIMANQISLTIGGEEGGRVESLVKGGGWDKFTGSFKTQLEIIKNMVGPVTPLFDKRLYQPPPSTSTAKTGMGADCVYYYHEDNVFRDCSENQIEEYEKCQDNEEAAENENIRCDRFRDPKEYTSITNYLAKQQALQRKNAQTKEEVETAFVYKVTMDSVAEQNIYLIDQVMWDMNMHIQRGYGDEGGPDDTSIPTLTGEIEVLSDKQCPNH